MIASEYFFNSTLFYTIYLIGSVAILWGLKVFFCRSGGLDQVEKVLGVISYFSPYIWFFRAR